MAYNLLTFHTVLPPFSDVLEQFLIGIGLIGPSKLPENSSFLRRWVHHALDGVKSLIVYLRSDYHMVGSNLMRITKNTLISPPGHKLIGVGPCSMSWLVDGRVRKVLHVWPDHPDITESNRTACRTEANVYRILGNHPLIANCLLIDSEKLLLELEYYPNGNLREYAKGHEITEATMTGWARQMIEGVAYVHSRGVRHSDLRLNQWLVGADLNVRLADFNVSGYDAQPELGLEYRRAMGLGDANYCLPRDFEKDSTIASDLFALGSSLYELTTGHKPYDGMEDGEIEKLFTEHKFPSTDGVLLGDIILGCWMCKFASADEILQEQWPMD